MNSSPEVADGGDGVEGGVRLERCVESDVRSAEGDVRVRVERGGEGWSEGFPGGLGETRGQEVGCYWSAVTCLVILWGGGVR